MGNNPVRWRDPLGLYIFDWHLKVTIMAMEMEGHCFDDSTQLARQVALVDAREGSFDVDNAHMHAMGTAGTHPWRRKAAYYNYISDSANAGDHAAAIHAIQDSTAGGHKGFPDWDGGGLFGYPGTGHLYDDIFPGIADVRAALEKTRQYIRENMPSPGSCECAQ